MKTTFSILTLILAATGVYAQGTAFTYQGRLNSGGVPANGTYDLVFTIYDLPTGSGAFANQTNSAIAVSNGLFTVTLNLGLPGIFTGEDRWLEIEVRTNGPGAYAKLTPRQKITPTPYAITAGNLVGGGLSGTYSNAVTFNNLANNFSGNGGGLTNVNAVTLGGLSASNVWKTGGNAGTTPDVNFLGSTDNQPLVLKVNNATALQFMPGNTLPNVVGGLAAFRPSVIAPGVSGAVIAGGNAPSGGVSGFGGGDFQAVYDNDGAIGGGFGNKVGNGNADVTDAAFATVAGGVFNSAANYAATVAGGDGNYSAGSRSFIGGGFGNQAIGDMSALGGGFQNSILTGGHYSTISGGKGNVIQAGVTNSIIGGGYNNSIQSDASASVLGGGAGNSIQEDAGSSVLCGGANNSIQTNAYLSVLGGGANNYILPYARVSFLGGGSDNSIRPYASYCVLGGGQNNIIQTNAYYSVLGGGYNNYILPNAPYSVLGGGQYNFIQTNSPSATIGGGQNNSISPGAFGYVSAKGATIGGGVGNTVFGLGGFPEGPLYNEYGTIGGGYSNTVNGSYGTVPGGCFNTASGDFSFAAGYRATAGYGCFVWADSSSISNFSSTANNQFSIRAAGGVRFTSGSGAANQTVSWAPGSGSWSFSSDRALKEGFEPVDGTAVLEKVARLPISEWNYIGYPQRHIGAMAQDFQAAFPLNESATTLNDADLHGVALAAIQGLNQKLTEELNRRDAENAALKQTVNELKQLIQVVNQKLNGGAK